MYDAERQFPTHALQLSRAQASSLPNLRPAQGATPVGSVPPSQRGLRRDMSEGALRQQPGRLPSGPGTPAGVGRMPSGPGTPVRQLGTPASRPTGQGAREPLPMPPGQTAPPGEAY